MMPSEEGPTFLWDDSLPGFGVKCLTSGKKRYFVKYRVGGGRNARQRWLMLGTHGQLTPEQARKLALAALAAVAAGDDPQQEKLQVRRGNKVHDLWLRFEEEHLPSRKPRTQDEYRSQWQRVLAPSLGHLPCKSVSRDDVDRLHKSLRRSPYYANRVLALLSRLMSLAEVWGMRPQGSNPCKAISRFKETARSRYLGKEEISRLGEALRDLEAKQLITSNAVNAIKLLLLTGARLNEVLCARWDWVDAERRVLMLPDSKGGARAIFLSEAAIEVLTTQREPDRGSPFIFPGSGAEGHMINLRKPWVRVCTAAGIEGVRLHDLRHTAASIAVGQGSSLAIIGRFLGHTQAQTTQRYAHVDLDPAMRAANAIGQFVSDAFEPQRAK